MSIPAVVEQEGGLGGGMQISYLLGQGKWQLGLGGSLGITNISEGDSVTLEGGQIADSWRAGWVHLGFQPSLFWATSPQAAWELRGLVGPAQVQSTALISDNDRTPELTANEWGLMYGGSLLVHLRSSSENPGMGGHIGFGVAHVPTTRLMVGRSAFISLAEIGIDGWAF
jgi:hypothetical protein